MIRLLALVLAAALAGALTVLSGCSEPPAARQPVAAPPVEPAPAPIETMTPDQKRSAISSGFPIEVPVPVGEFTRAQAQGDEAWDYTVRIAAQPEAVLAWYRNAYGSRQWQLVSEKEFAGTETVDKARVLTFRKGNAGSEVAVDAAADAGGVTTARVVLGVGVEVIQTQ